jgi:hypothetical protein
MLTTPAADEDQKLLLYIDFVCAEQGVVLPWDSIAATMEPRDTAKGEKPMTGEAIKQHLAKLRDHRDAQGHGVPPKLDRGARRSIVGKNTPSTPAPTPRKPSGLAGPPTFPKLASFGRGKAQGAEKETPVKKGSSLVAPVSKSKQAKVEKALKQALLSSGSGDATATTSHGGKTVGGLKATTGKRGRRSAAAAAAAATEDEDRDDTASSGVVRGKQSRHPERKNYDSGELGIKDEPESEDDVPLSKRRNTGQTLGGRKKTGAVGLMGDTVQMWQNRNGQSTVGESAAQSPDIQQSIEQVNGVPSNGNGNSTNQEVHAGLSQATLGESHNDGGFLSGGSHYQQDFRLPQALVTGSSNEMGFDFNPVNYQAQGVNGHLNQQLSGDTSDAFIPEFDFAHPSPMGLNFVDYQAHGHRGGAPGRIYVSPHSNNYTGQRSNDNPLTSSPLWGSFSSAALPGSDLSHPGSRITSTNTSFSNTQGLQDPFTGNNGYFGGLPAQGPPSMGNWGAQPTQAAAETAFDAGRQYQGYPDSQASSGCSNPNFIMPTSGVGLGISHTQSGGNGFEPPTETKVGETYPHLAQPMDSAFGMATGSSDLFDPNDPFSMGDFMNENFLDPLHGDDLNG